jgi:hypothetical protein
MPDSPRIGVPYLGIWNEEVEDSLGFSKALPTFTVDLTRASVKFWTWMNKEHSRNFKVREAPRFPFNYVPRTTGGSGTLWNTRRFNEILEMDLVKAIEVRIPGAVGQ